MFPDTYTKQIPLSAKYWPASQQIREVMGLNLGPAFGYHDSVNSFLSVPWRKYSCDNNKKQVTNASSQIFPSSLVTITLPLDVI
jgi:hypothetical protein